MNPLSAFIAYFRARRLSRIASEQERRRQVIKQQIADRRAGRREFRPLYGELRLSTHAALAAGIGHELPARRREA